MQGARKIRTMRSTPIVRSLPGLDSAHGWGNFWFTGYAVAVAGMSRCAAPLAGGRDA